MDCRDKSCGMPPFQRIIGGHGIWHDPEMGLADGLAQARLARCRFSMGQIVQLREQVIHDQARALNALPSLISSA